jgi:hypothetical protein
LSFARIPLAALALCCLLTGGTLLASRLLPAPRDPSLIARNPCALPCFFGVTPGVTTRDKAPDILARHVAATQVSDYLITFPLVDQEGRAALASLYFEPGGLLTSARLIAIDSFTDLGQISDLMLAEQTPSHLFRTCIGVLPIRFLVTFGEQEQTLVELFPQEALTPDTPLTLFDLSVAGSRSLYDARASFGCSVETRWFGFAPVSRYLAFAYLETIAQFTTP